MASTFHCAKCNKQYPLLPELGESIESYTNRLLLQDRMLCPRCGTLISPCNKSSNERAKPCRS